MDLIENKISESLALSEERDSATSFSMDLSFAKNVDSIKECNGLDNTIDEECTALDDKNEHGGTNGVFNLPSDIESMEESCNLSSDLALSSLGSDEDEQLASLDYTELSSPSPCCDVDCSDRDIDDGQILDFNKASPPSLFQCLICLDHNSSLEHLARHFVTELTSKLLEKSINPNNRNQCSECDFVAFRQPDLALHYGVEHRFLDDILINEALVNSKKNGDFSSFQTSTCLICQISVKKSYARKHIALHYRDELNVLVRVEAGGAAFCPECDFHAEKVSCVATHLALIHSKIDELVKDNSLLQRKKMLAYGARARKLTMDKACQICGLKDPTRKHVVSHFRKEMLTLVTELNGFAHCSQCSYSGETSKNLAYHLVFVHSRFDKWLADSALVESKRFKFITKPKTIWNRSNCPICDQILTERRSTSHLIWHFWGELRKVVDNFDDPSRCPECEYNNVRVNKMVKHVGRFHSKLEEMLSDSTLIYQKRLIYLAKPKRQTNGSSCPVCNIPDSSRIHIVKHFSDELTAYVKEKFPDVSSCIDCNYEGENLRQFVLHIALVHHRLDYYLDDTALVMAKRAKYPLTPKKISVGSTCPICQIVYNKSTIRMHLSCHFVDKLREYVKSFPDPLSCPLCPYKCEKLIYTIKHLALGHSMLDEFLSDPDLITAERLKYAQGQQKISMYSSCPVCDLREPLRKHILTHFMDELILIVDFYPDNTVCIDCGYKADCRKLLATHVALVHAKLDELLLNQDMVASKRKKFKTLIKLRLGSLCPVCDAKFKFTTSQNRRHVTMHFRDELELIIRKFSDVSQCNKCSYRNEVLDNMLYHVAFSHSTLDMFLQDKELVNRKRSDIPRIEKMQLFDSCPICDLKDVKYRHLARHFIKELLDMVRCFESPRHCNRCKYTSPKVKQVAIHVAIRHYVVLNDLLFDSALIQQKRILWQAKPPKLDMRESCPICDLLFMKGSYREHVAGHFIKEVRETVIASDDTTSCPECNYTTDNIKKLIKHLLLGHSRLDVLLNDEDLVALKRQKALLNSKKIKIGPICPICSVTFVIKKKRIHLVYHFMEELRQFVADTSHQTSCILCSYVTDKLDYLARHYALGHLKLDEFLSDHDLMEKKRNAFEKQKKIVSKSDCPICDVPDRDRDHIARHFLPELLEMVERFSVNGSCNMCEYKNKRADYMAKHLALFHCKLDELMSNSQLVDEKRQIAAKKPKKISMGDRCLFCPTLMPSREHVVKHFMSELSEIVDTFPNQLACNECSYVAKRIDYMARHLGLFHCKLDQMLQDKLLMQSKLEALSSSDGGVSAIQPSTFSSTPQLTKVRKSLRQRFTPLRVSDINTDGPHKRKLPSSELKQKIKAKDSLPSESLVKSFKPKKTSKVKSVPVTSNTLKQTTTNRCYSNFSQSSDSIIKIKRATTAKWQIKPRTTINFNSNWLHSSPVSSNGISVSQSFQCTPKKRKLTAMPNNDSYPSNAGLLSGSSMSILEPQVILNDSNEFERNSESQEMISLASKSNMADDLTFEAEAQDDHDVNNFNAYEEEEGYTMVVPELCSASPEDAHVGVAMPQMIICPVCEKSLSKAEERNHVLRHFIVNIKAMLSDSNPRQCPECDFMGDKVVRHIAFTHGQLDVFLSDVDLVASKRRRSLNGHNKIRRKESGLSIMAACGSECPICDLKTPSKEHIARHFKDDLLNIVATLPDFLSCNQCNYVGEQPSNLAKHIGLTHSRLTDILENKSLVEMKRSEFMSKTKKIQIGPECPICAIKLNKQDARVHVLTHFMDDLRREVISFQDPSVCPYCLFVNDRVGKMAKHLALGHSKLDEMLRNPQLIEIKRQSLKVEPQKIQLGHLCPICDHTFSKGKNRDHVAAHFMEELREMVHSLPDQFSCHLCSYTSDKTDNLVKHLALRHSFLTKLLSNTELVAKKRAISLSKPKKLQIGPNCPVCDVLFNKNQKREHVTQHFVEDLRQHIAETFTDVTMCNQCEYSSDRIDSMIKHLALGHSKLDEFLQQKDLIEAKRLYFQKIPKKYLCKKCPICDFVLPTRDHLARHCMEDLVQHIKSNFDSLQNCSLCEYKNDKMENLARHVGLYHSKVDEFLFDSSFVQRKREAHFEALCEKEILIPCQVCDIPLKKPRIREHTARHFQNEVIQIVKNFARPNVCDLCTSTGNRFKNRKSDNMYRHVALTHGKMNEFLADTALLTAKKLAFNVHKNTVQTD